MKALKYTYPRAVITAVTPYLQKHLVGSKDFHNPDELKDFIILINCLSGLKLEVCDVYCYDTCIDNTISNYIYRRFNIDYHEIGDNFSMVLCEPNTEPEFNGFVNTLPQALEYIDQYWFIKAREKENGK